MPLDASKSSVMALDAQQAPHTWQFADPGRTTVAGSEERTRLEARVEDELSEHELVGALDGGRHTPLERHHAILVHIPAHTISHICSRSPKAPSLDTILFKCSSADCHIADRDKQRCLILVRP